MSDLLLSFRRAATLDAVGGVRARRVAAVVAFAILTALAARAAVPLPGTAVPVTLQTLVVSLSGLLLGPVLGAAAQALYLAAGALGLPVFAAGGGLAYLFGPTGGYLLAYPVAAALTGALAPPPRPRTAAGEAGAGIAAELRHLAALAVATFLGTVVVFVGGAAQLAILMGDVGTAIRVGVVPFLVGDVVKVLLAVLVARRLRGRTPGLL